MIATIVRQLTLQAVLVIVMVIIERSFTKNIQIGRVLSHLFRLTLTANMMIEADNVIGGRHHKV
jgi:hypothetical protein